ncbi:hypothetical protein SAMN05428988_3215 [Chitinophaga sp. YR573]|uniref:hypothetical protein n=1 Tax=Chitinophaga sp. YR573 TaxID=1881040 RepID=UPI0008C4F01A|nr:hypothetical protein [Chitinophaga sp. YR573]SEW21478.1 hypothetical protein SAMN05428988_3215 [Chitinophaga sp. YR573]
MIAVQQLLYDIDLKLNKVATSSHQFISLEDKLIAINDAQYLLIKQKVAGSVNTAGLDGNKRRYDDLENLIVPHTMLPVFEDNSDGLPGYYSDLSGLSLPYMFFIDAFFICKKGTCKDRVVHGFRIKHADLQQVLKNSNICPSFEYQEMPFTVTSGRLYGFTDGTYTVDHTYLSYIRYPSRVDMEGYIDFNGAPSVTTDCELKQYLKDELVDIATGQLAMNTENTPAAGYAQARIHQQP